MHEWNVCLERPHDQVRGLSIQRNVVVVAEEPELAVEKAQRYKAKAKEIAHSPTHRRVLCRSL